MKIVPLNKYLGALCEIKDLLSKLLLIFHDTTYANNIQIRRSRRYILFTTVIFIFYDLNVFQVNQYFCGKKHNKKQQLCGKTSL